MKPRIFKVSLFLISQILPSLGNASSLIPFRSGASLGANLKITELPKELFKKNLKNGFTTTLLYKVSIQNPKGPLPANQQVFTVYYDLWNEEFYANFPLAPGKKPAVLRTPEEVMARMEEVVFLPLTPLVELDPQAPIQIKAQVYLDPIQKDRLAAVGKWISENSLSIERTSSPNSVFSALVNQYLNEGLASLSWKTEISSKPFRVSDLKPLTEGAP